MSNLPLPCLAMVLVCLPAWPAYAQAPRKARVVRVAHEGVRISVAFSPDGKYLATGGQDNHIRLWHLPTGKPARTIAAHDAPAGISRIAFFPDGKTLVSGSWAGDGTVKLWDVATCKQTKLVGKNHGGVAFLSVSAKGTLLAWNSPGKISLFDPVADKESHVLSAKAAVDSVAFSPDGSTLAAAVGNGTVMLWDTATGNVIHVLRASASSHTGSQAVAFSPDGKTLATAGDEVRLWETGTGKKKETLGAPKEVAYYIAYSPDGRLLAIATYSALGLWDTASGKEVRTWNEHAKSVAFSADSRWLAFGSMDGATLVELKQPKRKNQP